MTTRWTGQPLDTPLDGFSESIVTTGNLRLTRLSIQAARQGPVNLRLTRLSIQAAEQGPVNLLLSRLSVQVAISHALRVWDGDNWVGVAAHTYNNSSWENTIMTAYDGNAWVP